MNEKINWKEDIKKYFPDKINKALSNIDEETANSVEEIRLRAGRPLMVYTCDESIQVPAKKPIVIISEQIEEVFSAVTGKSHYAYKDEISQGFFTLESGIRLGLSGSVLISQGKISSFINITGINFRIPRQKKGIARQLLPYILQTGRLLNTLIISSPRLGKTTLARDIARCAGSGDGMKSCKVSLIDERQELSGTGSEGALFDVGNETDVLSGVPKHIGVTMALRALSPDVIVTDEIGHEADLASIREAANSGVTMIATAHSADITSLLRRLFFDRLYKERLFERYVILSDTFGRITVENILDQDKNKLIGASLLLCGDEP